MRIEVTPKLIARFWSKVDCTGDGCWEWQPKARTKHGYGKFGVNGRGWERAHRVADTIINGPIPPGVRVRHTCDNPPCCRPSHLVRGTAKQNSADMVSRERSKGRGPDLRPRKVRDLSTYALGVPHKRWPPLTPDQITECRRLRKQGVSIRKTADMIGSIERIVSKALRA